MTDERASHESTGDIALVFDALGAPARRAILDVLAERDDQTLFELCGRLSTEHERALTRQAISQHLAVLEAAGLVRSRRDGRYKFHTIDRAPLRAALRRWLEPSNQATNQASDQPTSQPTHEQEDPT